MAAPNSAERKACWNARDQLWKCMDENNDNASLCQKFQTEFEANCPAQWVSISFKKSTLGPTSLQNNSQRVFSVLSGKIFHQEERLPEIQSKDGERRLLTCRRPQAAFLTNGAYHSLGTDRLSAMEISTQEEGGTGPSCQDHYLLEIMPSNAALAVVFHK